MILVAAGVLLWIEIDYGVIAPWWLWATVFFEFIDSCAAGHMIRHTYKRVMLQ